MFYDLCFMKIYFWSCYMHTVVLKLVPQLALLTQDIHSIVFYQISFWFKLQILKLPTKKMEFGCGIFFSCISKYMTFTEMQNPRLTFWPLGLFSPLRSHMKTFNNLIPIFLPELISKLLFVCSHRIIESLRFYEISQII